MLSQDKSVRSNHLNELERDVRSRGVRSSNVLGRAAMPNLGLQQLLIIIPHSAMTEDLPCQLIKPNINGWL